MRAKPGELKAYWSKREKDILFDRGEGVYREDGHYLYGVVACRRMTVSLTNKPYDWEQSFLDELKARGYDITTLKFSIKKKTT